jgi:hypothetical protein
MIQALLLCLTLLQISPVTKMRPIIENERVKVWDVTGADPQPFDTVVVSLNGKVTWWAKNSRPELDGRSIVINLKDVSVPPLENKTGLPLAFPRPGSRKLLENDRVIVWDYSWTPGVPTPKHFHDKDVVVVFLADGDVKSTTLDGKETVTSYKAGDVRFNRGNRAHFETLARGQQHAIITELK